MIQIVIAWAISQAEAERLAAAANVNVVTFVRALAGLPLKRSTGLRVAKVLSSRGITYRLADPVARPARTREVRA